MFFSADPTDAMVAVAKIAAQPYVASKEHIIEHPAGHMTMKRLILNDSERIKAGSKGDKGIIAVQILYCVLNN